MPSANKNLCITGPCTEDTKVQSVPRAQVCLEQMVMYVLPITRISGAVTEITDCYTR